MSGFRVDPRAAEAAESFARQWLDALFRVPGMEGLFEVGDATPREGGVALLLQPVEVSRYSPGRWAELTGSLQTLLESALERRNLASAAVELVLPLGVPPEGRVDGDEGLTEAALALARTAIAHQRPFALGPMSVHERRQVHQALGDVPEVWTQSEGEGILRRLWVIPRAPRTEEVDEEAPEGGEAPSEA